MSNANEALALMQSALDAILLNAAYVPINVEALPEEFAALACKINQLAQHIGQTNDCIVGLSKGNLKIDLPPRSNYLASGVKQLHAHLSNLTWQTERIAKGDYKQKVDFMGDFSHAFNLMTSQLKERESRLNAHNEIMYTIFDHIESVFIINTDDRKEAYFINRNARTVFDIKDTLDLTEAMDRSPFLQKLFTLMSMDDIQELYDNSSEKWYNIITAPLHWIDERPALLIYCMDITTHKERESLLQMDAQTDPLTGLFNRRAMDQYTHRDWQYTKRNQLPISALIVDIDFFKRYNDTYGHLQGDFCLQEIAKCISSVFTRSTDLVTRFGGEEFVVILPNTDAQSAMKLAEKTRLAVQALCIAYKSNPQEITRVTASIGVSSLIPSEDVSPSTLLRLADDALYQSKASGRNRVTLAGEAQE